MFLLVGLGNPGPKYFNTRHNLGFIILDSLYHLLKKNPPSYKFDKKYNAEIIEHDEVIYFKPMTFMNLSGDAVSKYVNFLKIPLENVCILHDDLDLKAGQMKFKMDGGTAGQKGLTDIVLKLGTDKIPRIRLGIGKPHDPRFEISSFVLSSLTDLELSHWKNAIPTISQAVTEWKKGDIKKAQSLINSFKPIEA